MNTYLLLDCRSWECQDEIREKVIDILYRNQIFREVRAFDNEVLIIGTSEGEHDVISENIIIDVPTSRLKGIMRGSRYGRKTFAE